MSHLQELERRWVRFALIIRENKFPVYSRALAIGIQLARKDITFYNLARLLIDMLLSAHDGHHALHFSNVVISAVILFKLLPSLKKSNALQRNIVRQYYGNTKLQDDSPRPSVLCS